MRMREFIRENRDELTEAIRCALDDPDARLNDDDREQWIMNDENLYSWARSAGVPV